MYFDQQYQLIRSSRKALLQYCQTISNVHFLTENSSFGRGSIRNLLVHIGNTYEFWIGKHALKEDITFTSYGRIQNVLETDAFFLTIDDLINRFIDAYSIKCNDDLEIDIGGKKILASPFKLFTHVITHEFHHKGQILSLSRQLGYVPVDTDIIR
jgi:uncharacterized damage-inducible protein DinB